MLARADEPARAERRLPFLKTQIASLGRPAQRSFNRVFASRVGLTVPVGRGPAGTLVPT